MPDRKYVNDMGSWKRLGRRWIAILSVLLSGNCCLVVLAVAGFGGATLSPGAVNTIVADGSPANLGAVVDDSRNEAPVVSDEAKPETTLTAQQEPADTTIAATAAPAPATAEPPVPAESLAEPALTVEKPRLGVEQPQSGGAEPAQGAQDDLVPRVIDETGDKELAKTGLVIVNPPTTGGMVYFVVEEETYSLPAGTYCRFIGMNPKRVVFHKGDDESDVEHELETGLFAFEVGSAGWELAPLTSESGRKLLLGCRLAAE